MRAIGTAISQVSPSAGQRRSICPPSWPVIVASITRERRTVEPRVLELTEEQRQALPVPPRRNAPPAEPAGPVREYPPLEPT